MRFSSLPARQSILLAATLLLWGCGGAGLGITDGGPVGTGISASVVGNVVAVEEFEAVDTTTDLASASAVTEVEGLQQLASLDGIDVSLVEFPDLATTTDADGNFSIDGEFSGAVTLRFRTTDFETEQELDVPTGGVVVLSDIELDIEGVTAEAGRQILGAGRVREVDCAAGELRIEDRDGDRIDVTLIDETEFSRAGSAASCDDIRERDDIAVQGLLNDLRRRAVTALRIVIEPDDSPPQLERQVAFRGNITVIDCDAGGIALHDGTHLVRIRLPSSAVIRTPQDRRLECEDLTLGDRVTGGGLLNLRAPGAILGQLVIVGGRQGPGFELPIRGLVIAADCDEGILQVARQGAFVSVRILPDTRIRAPRDFVCEDLAVPNGSSVEGKGIVSTDLPGGLDAVELEFKKVKRKP